MFSKACEYGIRASIFIALNSLEHRRVGPKEIAKEINSPEAFTAKILQALVRNNVVNSVKGAHGGFEIDKKDIKTIMIADIVKAIDGDNVYKGCGLGLHECNENKPCPMHEKFKLVRAELKYMLESTDLESLALDLKLGDTFLKV
ncbi:RrF2 family transcriptional regulator [Formosa algae]|uniref:Rrf2 family protein n=1 Tax=Formosa algae TaxID=225843 RepID=A0A9X0YKA5_9FLAO|nr:Rrf2 family transcriptional regulator [Formosa algae]MBP1840146.1 Rrf2 family protein [Formosa algae]MDQ0335746.1 Rrf2 family protein [Formosa algae]OEI79785.1 Rrf2 family transcriptional regulator [Formosa algae]PNW29739.1 transcriptional regulator [Formosa algae]